MVVVVTYNTVCQNGFHINSAQLRLSHVQSAHTNYCKGPRLGPWLHELHVRFSYCSHPGSWLNSRNTCGKVEHATTITLQHCHVSQVTSSCIWPPGPCLRLAGVVLGKLLLSAQGCSDPANLKPWRARSSNWMTLISFKSHRPSSSACLLLACLVP